MAAGAAPPGEDRLTGSRRADACALTSARTSEPLWGTAGAKPAWLLIEHAGPWPSDVLPATLPGDVLEGVATRAPDVRLALIRRSGRQVVTRPKCLIARTTGSGAPWLRELELADYGEVLDLDLEAVQEGTQPGDGSARSEPVYLVCTHGRRDVCCAEFGRPVHRALDGAGHDVWEATHIGGDRFAASMICFPHGFYYGHLNPVSAVAVANSYRDGQIQLSNFRGRSGLAQPAQAAEHFVREATGCDGVGQVVADAATLVVTGTAAEVRVRAADQDFRVRLRARDHPGRVIGACGETEPAHRTVWWLQDLRATG